MGKGQGSNRPCIVQLVNLEAEQRGYEQPASGKHDSLKRSSNFSSPSALPDSPLVKKKCVPPKKSNYQPNTHIWELPFFRFSSVSSVQF